MNLPILAVDRDIERSLKIQSYWQKRSISTVRVNSMQEAIDMLLCKQSFLFTGINADNVEYKPLLKTMRELSSVPIFIITSNFKLRDQTKALSDGADGYAPFSEDIDDDIDSALALLKRCEYRNNQSRRPINLIVEDNLLLVEPYRKLYKHDREIKLTSREYDVLYMLMSNRSRVFSPEKIYKQVWGLRFDEDAKEIIWTMIKRLRKKLRMTDSQSLDYIKTIRDVGYSFNP